MPDSLGTFLKRSVSETKTSAVAKRIGISVGLLSQLLNNKAQLSDKVIEKIADNLSDGDVSRKTKIKQELENIRLSAVADSKSDALKVFGKFFETDPDSRRLMCITYRDIPQSTSTGKYPGMIDIGVEAIKNGLCCAMFQSFGPVEDIKDRVIKALESNDVEESERWNYIYRVVRDIQEVYERIKKGLEDVGDKCKGQVVLYEAKHFDPLSCYVHSRLFYSQELLGAQNRVRVAQLVAGIEDVYYIECDPQAVNQFAVAAQFYPIPRYWRENEHRLPDTENELEKAYTKDNEKRRWKIYV